MDILLPFAFLLLVCQAMSTDKLSETFEKFYTTDSSYAHPSNRQHSAIGISTMAEFSMLSNTPTLFKVDRPGLDNEVNTVSLQSIQQPGLYLRYKNYKFHMEKYDGSALFKKDATLRERIGPHGRAYELLGRDNWFMCHSDATPYTLQPRSEKIGTQDFVKYCVYVPVKQDMVEKKNIVKTLPSGGAMVVNHVPTTQETDKCISVRFVNHLGGPVRVVSSLKPEGYLVTANAFKLKTIFKHANHKQRHVIFYAENVQDRDDDVLLNNRNVFTVKPHDCSKDFTNVVLSSEINDAASDAAMLNDGSVTPSPRNNETSASLNELTNKTPIPPALGDGTTTSSALNDGLRKPPAADNTGNLGATMKPPANPAVSQNPPTNTQPKSAPSSTTLSIQKDAKPVIQSNGVLERQGNTNVPASELVSSKPMYQAPPNIKPTARTSLGQQPVITANGIMPEKAKQASTSYTAPLQQQIQTLDNVLQKRIQTQARPVFNNVLPNPATQMTFSSGRPEGYEAWSSFGPCSVTCGVGMRRRTRICRPGTYCFGPAAETRACIKEQCPSNCIHTTGGVVRDGSCCHFPFSFNGNQYYHCILSQRNNERMWCSTTPYYERDKQWGYCPRSAKAPAHPFVKPVQPVEPSEQLQGTEFQSDNEYYDNPSYTDDDNAYRPCSAMCSRVCDETCPKHCCLSVRANLPITAYMGNNYDSNDKRSHVYPFTPKY
ncbi:uncharacterized protein LOC114523599 [Dendronephthya gigantea]|uniref:uncharacterized protein LOC114523599 n=1 Tax=Dendronephthya gigantea TaxID=151771 RepID=UPI00106A3B20|nr:uncharacterized protein LOC114523599 [Dendronephthya gigantea]